MEEKKSKFKLPILNTKMKTSPKKVSFQEKLKPIKVYPETERLHKKSSKSSVEIPEEIPNTFLIHNLKLAINKNDKNQQKLKTKVQKVQKFKDMTMLIGDLWTERFKKKIISIYNNSEKKLAPNEITHALFRDKKDHFIQKNYGEIKKKERSNLKEDYHSDSDYSSYYDYSEKGEEGIFGLNTLKDVNEDITNRIINYLKPPKKSKIGKKINIFKNKSQPHVKHDYKRDRFYSPSGKLFPQITKRTRRVESDMKNHKQQISKIFKEFDKYRLIDGKNMERTQNFFKRALTTEPSCTSGVMDNSEKRSSFSKMAMKMDNRNLDGYYQQLVRDELREKMAYLSEEDREKEVDMILKMNIAPSLKKAVMGVKEKTKKQMMF